jgi:hypothetical protein
MKTKTKTKTKLKTRFTSAIQAYEYVIYLRKNKLIPSNSRYEPAEPFILKDYSLAIDYSMDINQRLPEMERCIFKRCDIYDVAKYIDMFIKEKCEDIEKLIINKPDLLLYYISNVLKKSWPKAELIIAKKIEQDFEKKLSTGTIDYVFDFKNLDKNYFRIIEKQKRLKNLVLRHFSMMYVSGNYDYCSIDIESVAFGVLYLKKERWKELEKKIEIAKEKYSFFDPHNTYFNYIKKIIKELLIENKHEEIINKFYDYKYFSKIIKSLNETHHIPDCLRNVIIAESIIDPKKHKSFFEKEKSKIIKLKNQIEILINSGNISYEMSVKEMLGAL